VVHFLGRLARVFFYEALGLEALSRLARCLRQQRREFYSLCPYPQH